MMSASMTGIRARLAASVASVPVQGISTQAAMVLVTETGDFRRFEHPGKRLAMADQQAGHRDRNPGGPLTIR